MDRLFVATLALAGCGSGNNVTGAYRNASGAEIILNRDGTYRYMIGERTSPRDIQGTYTLSGDRILFGGTQNRFKEATLATDRLVVADSAGKMAFAKQ